MQLSPRIRDREDRPVPDGPAAGHQHLSPAAGLLLTHEINIGLIEDNWDDLPRLAESIEFGHTTASASSWGSGSCRSDDGELVREPPRSTRGLTHDHCARVPAAGFLMCCQVTGRHRFSLHSFVAQR